MIAGPSSRALRRELGPYWPVLVAPGPAGPAHVPRVDWPRHRSLTVTAERHYTAPPLVDHDDVTPDDAEGRPSWPVLEYADTPGALVAARPCRPHGPPRATRTEWGGPADR